MNTFYIEKYRCWKRRCIQYGYMIWYIMYKSSIMWSWYIYMEWAKRWIVILLFPYIKIEFCQQIFKDLKPTWLKWKGYQLSSVWTTLYPKSQQDRNMVATMSDLQLANKKTKISEDLLALNMRNLVLKYNYLFRR